MGQKTIQLGIIGAGFVAVHAHLPSFASLPDVNIQAIYDIDLKKAEETVKKFGGIAVNSLYELEQIPLDAVVICTPNATHAELAIQFLNRGLHVLCEKPMTISVEEAQIVYQAAKRSQAVFLMGFVNRYRTDVSSFKSEIDSGRIGVPQICRVVWKRKRGIPRPGSWFTNYELAGGGVLNDLGSHMIDLLYHIIGPYEPIKMMAGLYERPHAVSSEYQNTFGTTETGKNDVEDTALGMIHLSNGVVAHFEVSWLDDILGDFVEISVRGTEGTLTLETLFGFSRDNMKEGPILCWHPLGKSPMELPLSSINREMHEEYRLQAQHFRDCIYQGIPPSVTVEDGLRTVRTIRNLYQSAKVMEFV